MLVLLIIATGCDTTDPDTTPPAAPSGLSATSGASSVELQWSAPPDDDVAGYNIYRSTGSTPDPSTGTPVNDSPVTGTTFTDSGLTNGTMYTYRITAVDDSDNESPGSDSAAATPFGDPPARP